MTLGRIAVILATLIISGCGKPLDRNILPVYGQHQWKLDSVTCGPSQKPSSKLAERQSYGYDTYFYYDGDTQCAAAELAMDDQQDDLFVMGMMGCGIPVQEGAVSFTHALNAMAMDCLQGLSVWDNGSPQCWEPLGAAAALTIVQSPGRNPPTYQADLQSNKLVLTSSNGEDTNCVVEGYAAADQQPVTYHFVEIDTPGSNDKAAADWAWIALAQAH
jgi:hypothetical protein